VNTWFRILSIWYSEPEVAAHPIPLVLFYGIWLVFLPAGAGV
jgi:hypothetical protein